MALLAPVAITGLLRNRQLGAARSAWQAYIDMFGNQSFYSALQILFSGANPPGGKPDQLVESVRDDAAKILAR